MEEVITPASKDFSGEYSNDGNDEELQTLVTSPSLPAVGNESTINNYDQDKRNINKSSANQIQNLNTDNSQTKGVKTKLCKNIARVVGETETVYKLDTARQNMKQHPTSTFHTNNYQNLLAPMQTQILAQHTSFLNFVSLYCK